MKLPRLLLAASCTATIGCSGMSLRDFGNALVEAAHETVQQTNEAYGTSKYYQGSTLQQANNMLDAAASAGDLILDISDFGGKFLLEVDATYGREVLVSQLSADSLQKLVLKSLNGPNDGFRDALQSHYLNELNSQLKQRVHYDEFRVRADRVTEDVSSALTELKRSMER